MKLMSALLFCAALAAAGTTFGAEVEGVRIEDKTRVANADLTLNGAGLRKRAFFKVYAIGPLPAAEERERGRRSSSSQGRSASRSTCCATSSADAFTEALADGISANHTEAEVKALEPRIKELGAIMAEVKEAKKGMAITLDWTGSGTQVLVDGKPTRQADPGRGLLPRAAAHLARRQAGAGRPEEGAAGRLMAHHDFSAPISEAQARALRVNDTVTLNGTLFGIRDATQIHMFDRGRKTRFDLRGHAVIHTAPNVRKVEKSAHPAGYEPVCVGTTTSDRMERFTRPLMQQYGVRLVIGKGGLREDSLQGFRGTGRRVPRDHRRHGGAGDHLGRGDRGRGPRRPQPGVAVEVPRQRLRPAARCDGQPRRQPLCAGQGPQRSSGAPRRLTRLGVR